MTRPALIRITHSQEFSASHRLHNPALSDEENRRVFGPCNHLHGHNYVVEVTVRGEVAVHTGMVMNLNVLSGLVHERITSRVDHTHLDQDVPFLVGLITTAENLAVAFWAELEDSLTDFPGCKLHGIRVRESGDNSAEYLGPETTP